MDATTAIFIFSNRDFYQYFCIFLAFVGGIAMIVVIYLNSIIFYACLMNILKIILYGFLIFLIRLIIKKKYDES
jgi:hypothetical protein